MTTICIIRHGQTNLNKAKIIQGRQNFDLNEEGIRQAHLTGKYLKEIGEHFDIFYSSPLNRAYDTAKIIAQEIGYTGPILIEEGFIEREFGEADGANICEEIYDLILKDEVKGLEKSYEIQNRLENTVRKVCEENKDKRILVVSHSHAIKGLLTSIDKNRSFMDLLYNCAINYFNYDGKKITIEKVNISAIK